jgi:hypothetical protein
MNTSSESHPCKKAFWISIWRMGQSAKVVRERARQMVVGLTTGLKVSSKSTPGCWWNPLTTRRACDDQWSHQLCV